MSKGNKLLIIIDDVLPLDLSSFRNVELCEYAKEVLPHIEIAKETTKNNYTKNKLILHKLMGNEIEINKIDNSLLDTIDNYKQKKKI